MKLFLALLILFCKSDDHPPAPRYPLPTNETLKYQRKPLVAFIHFGLNTFTGSEEISDNTNPNTFNPTKLDTDQWASVIKQAGFNRIIFTAKHNDGFCLWKTNTTDYSISSSKHFQKQSKSGDILHDLMESCKKYNLELGLSVSLWDKHSDLYGKDEYNNLLYSQLKELLTNYGPIAEIHFDIYRDESETRKGQKYDFDRLINLINTQQPHCLIASPSNSTLRTIGRDFMSGDLSSFYSINSALVEDYFSKTHTVNSSYIIAGESIGDSYSAVEYDISIQKEGFFWSKSNENKLRSISELQQIYFDVVGQSQILLLGIAPNTEGLIPKHYSKLIHQLGQSITRSFGRNFANQSMAVSATAIRNRNMDLYDCRYLQWINDPQLYWSMNDGMLYGYVWFDFCKTIIFDVVSITEHLELGQRITKFTIDYEQNGFWKTFAEGLTIGELRMFRTKPISAQKLYIKIEDAEDVLALESFGIFKLDSESELGQFIPIRIFECDEKFEGEWTTDNESNLTSSGTLTTTFTGSYMSIVAPVDPGYGKFDVILDDEKIATIDLYFDYHRDRREVFRIESLEQKQHTVKIQPKSKTIGIYHIYYLDNYEIGLFEIASRNYEVLKGDSIDIEIKRIGGSKTNVSVTVKTDYFTGKQNQHFVPVNKIINFDENEISKIITIDTIKYDSEEDFIFNVVIDDATLGSEVGFNQSAMVTIRNSIDPDDDGGDNDNEAKVFTIVGIAFAGIMLVVIAVIIALLCRKRKNDDLKPLLTTS